MMRSSLGYGYRAFVATNDPNYALRQYCAGRPRARCLRAVTVLCVPAMGVTRRCKPSGVLGRRSPKRVARHRLRDQASKGPSGTHRQSNRCPCGHRTTQTPRLAAFPRPPRGWLTLFADVKTNHGAGALCGGATDVCPSASGCLLATDISRPVHQAVPNSASRSRVSRAQPGMRSLSGAYRNHVASVDAELEESIIP